MAEVNDPRDMTPNQAAAYVNGTCVVALSEMLSMHWDNEACKQKGVAIPHTGQHFQDHIRRHCVTHDNILTLFDSLRGRSV